MAEKLARAEDNRPKVAATIILAALFSLLLTASSSSSVQNPGVSSSPFYGMQGVAALPGPNWSGEFQWAASGPETLGDYSESGSGSFTFTVTPTPGEVEWNVTGSGTGTEQYEFKGAQGRCSGSGGGSFSFMLSGRYFPAIDNFSFSFQTPSFTPRNFTFNMTPVPCLPDTLDFITMPEGYNMKAEDGSTLQCTNAPSCATGGYETAFTYKVTIHGSSTTSTSSTTTTSTTTSCSSNSDQKLIFYVEKDGFPSGHGFMQFQTDSGPQAGQPDLVYGHGSVSGPFNTGFTRGPGAPQHGLLEADHPWDWRIVFHVNPCQYNAAADFVNGEIDRASTYSLTGLNCVDWIKYAASFAGLKLPASTDFLGVSDPSTLGDSFANIGNGGTFDGGVVQQNTAGTTPQDTPDPPTPPETLLASPIELLGYALQNTSALAASQNTTLQQSTLPPVELAAGGSLNLIFQNVPAGATLTVMDFGDGSQNATRTLQYSHVYTSAGTFHARAVIVSQNFTLYQASFNVTVTGAAASPRLALVASSSSSTTVTITVPNPPAQKSLNSASHVVAEHVAPIGASVTGGKGTSKLSPSRSLTTPSSSTALSYAVAGGVIVVATIVASVFFFRSRQGTRA